MTRTPSSPFQPFPFHFFSVSDRFFFPRSKFCQVAAQKLDQFRAKTGTTFGSKNGTTFGSTGLLKHVMMGPFLGPLLVPNLGPLLVQKLRHFWAIFGGRRVHNFRAAKSSRSPCKVHSHYGSASCTITFVPLVAPPSHPRFLLPLVPLSAFSKGSGQGRAKWAMLESCKHRTGIHSRVLSLFGAASCVPICYRVCPTPCALGTRSPSSARSLTCALHDAHSLFPFPALPLPFFLCL